MKRLITLTASLLALSGALQAGCMENCCPCGYFAGVEATFLRPCTSDLYYVVRGPTNATGVTVPLGGNLLAVQPDYSVGFNAWLGTCLCDGKYDARFVWQYLHSTDTRTVSSSGATEVLWVPGADERLAEGQARSRVQFDFDTADIEFGAIKRKACDLRVRLAAGIRYARIDYRNERRYAGRENTPAGSLEGTGWKENSNAWGVGPRVAADLHYCICGGFGVRGVVGVGLLAGEIHNSFLRFEAETPPGEIISTSSDTVCNLIPAVDAKIGLDYSTACGCVVFRLNAGYQIARYYSSVQRMFYTGTSDSEITDYHMKNTDFDLTGFYVGAEIGF